jgi:hypothetical protein
MTETDKHKIANSFPEKFEQSALDIEISQTEFKVFEDGIFAKSMDEKWHVFVVDKALYLTRSWTNFCIFKILTEFRKGKVVFLHFQVNRDESQYKSKDIKYDGILLRKLLQMFLGREDFYSDPELELPLIKATIERVAPNNECKKSIGSNNVGLTRKIYNGLTAEEQKQYCDVIGWTELKGRLLDKSDDEPLISLYLQKSGFSATYYFSNSADEILGQVTIQRK